MNTIQHHPENELLLSFSAASLPLSQALCISAHLEQCPSCAHKLTTLETLGSELLLDLKPAPPSGNLKSQIMGKLESIEQDLAPSKPRKPDSAVPRCLNQFFGVNTSFKSLDWKRVSTSIKIFELHRENNGAKVELLRIKPGGSAGRHTHLGDEYTVILKGSFSDDSGLYRKGDFIIRNSKHTHKPVATKDQECICLAVTEGPIHMTGFFGRLLNPLIRKSFTS